MYQWGAVGRKKELASVMGHYLRKLPSALVEEVRQLRTMGYSLEQMKQTKRYSCCDFIEVGFTDDELFEVGYTEDQCERAKEKTLSQRDEEHWNHENRFGR